MKISIIMTFFNEPRTLLKRSVESILNQTFQDFEFIIIAGNPENTDSIAYLKTLAANNQQIILQVAEKKLLMTICINRAVKMAKGEYVALQESDDESLPQRIEKQFLYMEDNKTIDVVGTAIAYINDSDKKLLLKRFYPPDPRKAFNKYTAIAHPTLFLKKEVFEKFGYYKEGEDVKYSPDHDLLCRWVIQGVKFYNIPEILLNYYQSESNGRNKNAKKTLRSVVKIKNKYADQMNFSFSDYFYLTLERFLLIFPQSIINKLFYIWARVISP